MSESEIETELYRQLRTSQDKITYFLLAAAASGIALAVNNTAGSILSYSQIPLALAVVSWGLSFYFGCQHLHYVASTLYANAALLDVLKGRHKEVGQNPHLIEAASSGIREAMESNIEIASKYGTWQFRLIVAGALFYIGWHLTEMAIRTITRGSAT